LLAALAAFFNHFFSPKVAVEPQHVVTGPGCSAVLDTLLHDICDDGDGILLAVPMWGAEQAHAASLPWMLLLTACVHR
jgi:histidinol-phosphate/aromatic aminotransferase/cobyric acid decarboxylase-like protein